MSDGLSTSWVLQSSIMSLGSFYYVYVLQNENGNWYTGCTSDLEKRLKDHGNGRSNHTRVRGPYHLIYYEACMNSKDAYNREKYLKTGIGKRYLKNRLKLHLQGAIKA